MSRLQWTCPACGRVQANTRSPKCVGCGENTRPPLRKPAHVKAKDALSYGDAAVLSVLIHGGEPHACAICGKPPKPGGRRKHHDRDHDHRLNRPRGLLCPGHNGCNTLIPASLTLERSLAITLYLLRVELFYARLRSERAA